MRRALYRGARTSHGSDILVHFQLDEIFRTVDAGCSSNLRYQVAGFVKGSTTNFSVVAVNDSIGQGILSAVVRRRCQAGLCNKDHGFVLDFTSPLLYAFSILIRAPSLHAVTLSHVAVLRSDDQMARCIKVGDCVCAEVGANENCLFWHSFTAQTKCPMQLTPRELTVKLESIAILATSAASASHLARHKLSGSLMGSLTNLLPYLNFVDITKIAQLSRAFRTSIAQPEVWMHLSGDHRACVSGVNMNQGLWHLYYMTGFNNKSHTWPQAVGDYVIGSRKYLSYQAPFDSITNNLPNFVPLSLEARFQLRGSPWCRVDQLSSNFVLSLTADLPPVDKPTSISLESPFQSNGNAIDLFCKTDGDAFRLIDPTLSVQLANSLPSTHVCPSQSPLSCLDQLCLKSSKM